MPFEKLKDPEGLAFWPRHKAPRRRPHADAVAAVAPFAGFSTAEPWLLVDPRHQPLAVDLQETDAASVLAFTRASWLGEKISLH